MKFSAFFETQLSRTTRGSETFNLDEFFRKSVENQLNIESKNQLKIKNTYSVMSDWDEILPGVRSDRDATFPACSVVKAYVLMSF